LELLNQNFVHESFTTKHVSQKPVGLLAI